MKKLNSGNKACPIIESSQTPSPFENIECILNIGNGVFEANMQT